MPRMCMWRHVYYLRAACPAEQWWDRDNEVLMNQSGLFGRFFCDNISTAFVDDICSAANLVDLKEMARHPRHSRQQSGHFCKLSLMSMLMKTLGNVNVNENFH